MNHRERRGVLFKQSSSKPECSHDALLSVSSAHSVVKLSFGFSFVARKLTSPGLGLVTV